MFRANPISQSCHKVETPITSASEPNCLHRLFETQAGFSPDAVAVELEDRRLTYRVLNQRANQLARVLRATHAVGPDVLVGLLAERSIETVVGLWAILKAGGAYVPLDPMYPAERLGFMLRDSRVQVLLRNRPLPRGITFPGVIVDLQDPAAYNGSGGPLEHEGSDSDLAYVIYTSGSTGRPKGVMLEHRQITNYIRWAIDTYLPSDARTIACCTSLSFDLTVTSIFAPLLSGRTMRIFPDDSYGPGWLAALADPAVDVIKLTPSHLRLLDAAGPQRHRKRVLIVGGEELPTSLAQAAWRYHQGDVEIYNEYGPTEAAVGCMMHQYSTGETASSVPIGRPAANVSLRLLDEFAQPVPIGIPGELFIGGAGLARGYLRQPELTAQRFVRDPFSTNGAERWFRTGDLAVWRADGVMEFLGRLDHQVKLRGFRIELGEIESVLREHPEVRDAVVGVREDNPGDQRLVAYLVSSANPVSAAELRQHLGRKLPDYMLPAAFVWLDRMPLTPNGKTDRTALPAPKAGVGGDDAHVAPRTSLEREIVSVWQDLLRVERVGLHDDFFLLGGHSLLAMQAVSRIHSQCGAALSLRDFFAAPTVAGLTAAITAATAPRDPTSTETDEGVI